MFQFGITGCFFSFQPISDINLSAFLALHFGQAATTLSHVFVPPLERGITWSMVVPLRSQCVNWHLLLSLIISVRRLRGTREPYGILTYSLSLITDGSMKSDLFEWIIVSDSSITSALSSRTRTRARRAEMTRIGSKVAFSSRTRSLSMRLVYQIPLRVVKHDRCGKFDTVNDLGEFTSSNVKHFRCRHRSYKALCRRFRVVLALAPPGPSLCPYSAYTGSLHPSFHHPRTVVARHPEQQNQIQQAGDSQHDERDDPDDPK